MRFFNTAGPVIRDRHYCIPPLERLDLKQVFELIEQMKFFVLHAPRQTGKTSALLALQDELNQNQRFRSVYVNVEVGQSAREDVAAAIHAILGELAYAANIALNDSFVDNNFLQILGKFGPHSAFRQVLSRWAANDSKPLVVMIDEIDSLVGDTLISVLRQLRSGYVNRPQNFPQSVILCGVRDVRHFRIHSSNGREVITGGSAFNVKAESLRLGDFDVEETNILLDQHTQETGQIWTEEARSEIWHQTQGQPWLVNALAYQASKTISVKQQTIHADVIFDAREQLIVRRETHLDQLTDKLREERVRSVIEPLLSGDPDSNEIPVDDLYYVRDLGLIRTDGMIRISNPIYQEVIPRDLTQVTQLRFTHNPAWYVKEGKLQVSSLIADFQDFFRIHSEHWIQRFQYEEAGPQLLLQAFLQRIVNSGSRIEREYGLGRMRTDLLIIWPVGRESIKTVIECKLLHGSLENTVNKGLEQTRAYMDRCNSDQGHLVIFDRSEEKSWERKIFCRQETIAGASITIWGM